MSSCQLCGGSCISFSECRRCISCGVIRSNYDYNAEIYDNKYAATYVEYSNTPINIPLNLFRLGLVSRWLCAKERILDIGCGIGEFIRFAEPYYECTGMEPNKFAAQLAEARTCSPISRSLPDGSGKKFRMVTMFDVLEHIEDPRSLLEALATHYTTEKGIFVITTPNAWFHIDDERALKNWKHYKPREHLFLYTLYGLSLFLTKMGFRILHQGSEESDIRPGNPRDDLMTVVVRKP